jgi:uncharacterized protein (UPF0305 family)
MSKTVTILQEEIPMQKEVKEKFLQRLLKIRNVVVADVQLTNGEDISDDSDKEEKVEEVKKQLEEETPKNKRILLRLLVLACILRILYTVWMRRS